MGPTSGSVPCDGNFDCRLGKMICNTQFLLRSRRPSRSWVPETRAHYICFDVNTSVDCKCHSADFSAMWWNTLICGRGRHVGTNSESWEGVGSQLRPMKQTVPYAILRIFNQALEFQESISINGKRLNNIIYADDIAIFANSVEDL